MSSKQRKSSNGSTIDKSFTLKRIIPKTSNQEDTLDSYNEGYNLLLHGVAGTGKTFLALWMGLNSILEEKYNKVIIVRSAVPSRDMGFLPGTAKEKAEVYETPYKSICSELFGRGDAYQILKTKGSIDFITTSHIRGITINNAVIIVEEFQNMNFQELDTIMTRVGNNCRIIFSGDIEQSDLNKPHDMSGLPKFFKIIDKIWNKEKPSESFDIIEFGIEDIVRSGLVKRYITAKHELNK